MKFPCELALWHIIPAIRARTAKILKETGLSQKEIAKALGVTEATVSHYFSKQRGAEFKLNDKYDKKLEKAVKDDKLISASCCICREIRKKGLACDFHKSCGCVENDCCLCMEK